IFVTGGTGVSKRDYTPETIKEIIDREIPGISEFIRNYGYIRTPYSILSRAISGIKNQTLIISLPGSSRGVKESLTAIIDYLPHAVKVSKIDSGGHE
ncbi:MAG: molybdenum cofactor biosynthesis protein B, partial [bacterium]